MALFGELSDLSLGELIEFFCNQRKTGRLKVVYPIGPGLFYLKSGSVVHAEIGELRGIEAVYFSLTQPNASFTFNAAFEPPEQTINQPWTSVVLEGLRRMDQGIPPPNPFPNGNQVDASEKSAVIEMVADKSEEVAPPKVSVGGAAKSDDVQAFGVLSSQSDHSKFQSRRWSTPAVIGAIALLIIVVGVPSVWYARSKGRQTPSVPAKVAENPIEAPTPLTSEVAASPSVEANPNNPSTAADAQAAKRLADARAKERARALEQSGNQPANSQTTAEVAPKPNPAPQKATNGAKNVTVTVTYDENGRVTGASGGDATALRIARQKRFPAGKPGSATVTIPIN